MAKSRFAKLFSEDEANELIPRLEILIRQLQMQANSLRARIEELAIDDPALRHCELSEIVDRHPELKSFTTNMAEAAGQIESFGCILKDIDHGLVDFPYDAGEDVVFLCWQFGESHVIAWHTIDSGFANRRPLPGATKQYLN